MTIRSPLRRLALAAAAFALAAPGIAFAQAKLKVAAVYTVPSSSNGSAACTRR